MAEKTKSSMFSLDRPSAVSGADMYVQQGARDVGKEAFAGLLASAGAQAFEYKVAKDVAQTSGEITDVVEAYTNQAADAVTLDAQIKQANDALITADDAVLYGGEGFQPPTMTEGEMGAINDAKTKLAKLQRAKANGNITEAEMRARVSDITRKGITLMPGRSAEFITAQNEALGTHAGNIMLENERQATLTAAAKSQAANQEHALKAAYKEVNDAGGILTDSSGNPLSMEQAVKANATLLQDRQTNKQVAARVAGNATMQQEVFSNPDMYNRVSTGILSELTVFNTVVEATQNPDGSPLTIEQKSLMLSSVKAQKLQELAATYGGASNTEQYKALVTSINQRAELLEKNLMGQTLKDHSTNLNTSAANAREQALWARPEIAKLLLLKQVTGDAGFIKLYTEGKIDAGIFDIISNMARGMQTKPEGVGSAKDNAYMAASVGVISNMLREVGNKEANWSVDDVQGALKITEGMLKQFNGADTKTTNALTAMLASDEFFGVADKLSPEAKKNTESRLFDFLHNTGLPALAQYYDSDTMVILGNKATGLRFEDISGTKEGIERVALLTQVADKLNTNVKAIAHLQGTDNIEPANERFISMITQADADAKAAIARKAQADYEKTQIRPNRLAEFGTREQRMTEFKAALKTMKAGQKQLEYPQTGTIGVPTAPPNVSTSNVPKNIPVRLADTGHDLADGTYSLPDGREIIVANGEATEVVK